MFLGIDLGSSGVRLAIADINKNLILYREIQYKFSFELGHDWLECCIDLINAIPKNIRSKIIACSVDGTSGTLIACNHEGKPYGKAIPFNHNFTENEAFINNLFPNLENALYKIPSLSRALSLIKRYGNNILIRHQADWINGWLINNWEFGEEGNNLKLGWDLINKKWPASYNGLEWKNGLPKVIPSGKSIGNICSKKADILGLPKDTLIISGTTDSNAAVIASHASINEGITILGSTIVIKKFSDQPIDSVGISNHRICGNWLIGGASNSGGNVLSKFFNPKEIEELSKQINPNKKTGIKLLPLNQKGERFPINDPNVEPVLEPRPISDSLYLHALLEGLAKIEAQGWNKLISLGIKTPKKIITLGAGAKNPQWRKIRENIINIPIESSYNQTAYGSALIAMKGFLNQNKNE